MGIFDNAAGLSGINQKKVRAAKVDEWLEKVGLFEDLQSYDI